MDNLITTIKNKNYYLVGITISLPLVISLGVIFDMLLVAALVVIPYGFFLGYLIKTYDQSKQKDKVKKVYLLLFGLGVVLFISATVIYLTQL